MIAITDRNGMSLRRYVVPRKKLTMPRWQSRQLVS